VKKKIVEKLKVENFDLTKKINIGTQVLEVGILDSKDNSGFTLTTTDDDWREFFVEAEEYATLTVTGQQSVVAPSAPTANPIYNPSKPGQKPLSQTVNFLNELNPANIKVGEKIAEGFFGVVYAGKLLSSDIAIKTFKDTIQNVDVEKEVKLIQ